MKSKRVLHGGSSRAGSGAGRRRGRSTRRQRAGGGKQGQVAHRTHEALRQS
ncbi:hypothetical protein U91I_03859 [alpha proteobacterium U9-1i]|nr:hypothetical protein U91I_03859 [alpha proteobacterium U9-1i]